MGHVWAGAGGRTGHVWAGAGGRMGHVWAGAGGQMGRLSGCWCPVTSQYCGNSQPQDAPTQAAAYQHMWASSQIPGAPHLFEGLGQVGLVPVAQRQRTLGQLALVGDVEVLPAMDEPKEFLG